MLIRSLNGDDEIIAALNIAMRQTVRSLYEADMLTKDDGEAFIREHVCMFVAEDGGLVEWFKQHFRKNPRKDMSHVLIMKVTGLTRSEKESDES